MLEAEQFFRFGSVIKKIQCLHLEPQRFLAADEKLVAAFQAGQSLNQGFSAGSRFGKVCKKEPESSQFVEHKIVDPQNLAGLQLDELGRAGERHVQNKRFD